MKTKIYGELIGKKIEITRAKNKSLVGISGKVADETRNTIKVIDEKNKEKTIIKKQVMFKEKKNEGKISRN